MKIVFSYNGIEHKYVIYTPRTKVIKIAIQILKSYDFTIQNMVDGSIHDSRRFYTFLANKENKRYILLVIANIVRKQPFFLNF